jgi:hypothetical protein
VSGRRVTWFGVRHHSPAAARLLSSLMAERPFGAVLVEGPSDFTPRIAELGLDHRPPIAVYSSAVVDGARRAAYHPFCAHSPEWIAVRAGLAAGWDVRFIDVPWGVLAALAAADEAVVGENRYADGPLTHVPGIGALCARLGVDDFDGAWDLLVESDPELSLDTYMSRVEALAGELRGDDPARVPREDRLREAFMAGEVARALEEVAGDVLVVCGAFHVAGLRALVEEGAVADPEDVVGVPAAREGDGRTLALTPYDDERLDALAGYDAGLPSPGFYAHAWAARAEGGTGGETAFDRALAEVVSGLRRAGRPIAPADLIAVRTTAGALARLRGHAEPWRRDLLDGVLGALVKDEVVLGAGHPVLDATRRVLRGHGRGALAPDAPRPPLVVDVAARLERLGLDPPARRRAVALDLTAAEDLVRSRVLHACAILGLPGFALEDAGDDDGVPAERWALRRDVGYEGALVEACAYGASLGEAVGARLLEAAGAPEAASAGAAAGLLEDALRAGVTELTEALARRLDAAVAHEADARQLARALARLTHLHRFEPVLGSAGRADVGALLGAALARGLWRLDPGGAAVPAEDAGTALVVSVAGAHERAGALLGFSDEEVADVLARLARSGAHPAGMRGAALGALWTLDAADADELAAAVDAFGDPVVLGDFLHGVFGVARDVVRRRPEVQAALDGVVNAYDDDAFLMALPGLRRAFSVFAPREKDALARALTGQARGGPLADPAEADALAAVEARVGALARELGVRGG